MSANILTSYTSVIQTYKWSREKGWNRKF